MLSKKHLRNTHMWYLNRLYTTSNDLEYIYTNNASFEDFENKLEEKASLQFSDKERREYLGDGFEFFVDVFVNMHLDNPKIGLSSYSRNEINEEGDIVFEEDYGVDGVGKNLRGDKAVVQVKYKAVRMTADGEVKLCGNRDHLSNMYLQGPDYGVVPDLENPDNKRHIIITNVKNVNDMTRKYHKRTHFVTRRVFTEMLKDNLTFWEAAYAAIKKG